MDREKLNEMVKLFRESLLRRNINLNFNKTWDDNLRPYEEAFREVVQFIIQQPLSERLTDKEKEKIRGYYNFAKNEEIYGKTQEERREGIAFIMVFHSIFGKEFFENN